MRHAIVVLFILAAVTFASGDTGQIPNLQNPRWEVYTAGQPSEENFQQLAAMGIKTVINVLPERQCMENEAKLVTENGMVYRSVPFHTSGFRMETVEQFADLMKKVRKPVLIHCSTGNHVGGLWFAYCVLVEKATLSLALREARQIGLQPFLEDAIFDWVVVEAQRAELIWAKSNAR